MPSYEDEECWRTLADGAASFADRLRLSGETALGEPQSEWRRDQISVAMD